MRLPAALCVALLSTGTHLNAQTTEKPPMTVEEAIRRLASNGGAGGMIGPTKSPADAAKTMRAFSTCVMSSPSEAGKMLGTLPGSEEEVELARHISDKRSGCLDSGSLRFGALLLRGTIAEGMLRRDFGGFGGSARRTPVAIYDLPPASSRSQLSPREQSALELQELAACVVARAPDKVGRLLLAPAATDDEANEWKRLSNDCNSCIDPHKSFKMSKLQLRGTLAEAAYRVSVMEARPHA